MPTTKNIELACLIVARNFGDAAIQSGFLKSLIERRYARRYVVWTRPQFAFFFQIDGGCEVVCSQFPVGTRKKFGLGALGTFLDAVRYIRNCRPDVTIDLVGDIRERLFARLLGSPQHLHIGWARDHAFRRMIRNPFGPGKPLVLVPATVPSVYSGHQMMLDALMPSPHGEAVTGVRSRTRRMAARPRVGLHPFASQRHRLWPGENWRQLAQELIAEGVHLYGFGAPTERRRLLDIFGEVDGRIEFITEDMESFARHLRSLDVLVGLNSFAVHMAWREGARTVMINGPTPEQLWSVPSGGRVLATSGGCPHYPCFDVPQCVGREKEYVCVRGISVWAVLEAVKSLL